MKRKNQALSTYPLYTLLLMLVGLLGWSCEPTNSNSTVDPSRTLAQLVQEQPELSSFYTALERLNLLGTLQSQNLSFTLFAPTNSAITAYLQQQGYTSLEQVPLAALDPLIRYHMLYGSRSTEALDSAVYISLGGQRLVAYTANNTVMLNKNSSLNSSSLQANNGLLYTLAEVLTPPTQSLMDLIETKAAAQPETFGLLQAALTKAGLTSLLKNAQQSLTLLAPTNAAFAAAGYPTAEAIESEDPAVLRSLLRYHLLPGHQFSHMLHSGSFRTQQGGSVRIDAAAGTIRGEGNAQPANLISSQLDYHTTNGVLHGIDAVLLPD